MDSSDQPLKHVHKQHVFQETTEGRGESSLPEGTMAVRAGPDSSQARLTQ